ncbi:hypothetical protein PGTUg99_024109 [Puccinia graminis f. sp. tritici]|uniref:Uncharacterized protein n=1 Tax=Puccinia graminis f. sp. tritici TaxID=56615 RepID=A0A5B0Q940_PUCGR|nr:hypothetical protein PGTUg99_024109 [Puccinia graminis f. sp. tritici]
MAGTTISHSTPGKQMESNPRKKRSSNNLSNTKPVKSNTGRWKNRPIRPQFKLNPEERKQVHDLLKKFSGPRNFTLPLDLPHWSPPSKLEDINPDLIIFRDYGSSLDDWDRSELKEEQARHPTESNNQNEWKQPSGPVHNSNRSSANSHAITITGINTAIASSSSASPETFSSPSDQIPKPRNGRSDHPEPRYELARNAKIPSEPQPDRSGVSIKGKEKADPEIDWTGWEAQAYNSNELERMRARYADRAKEFKRLSDVQRQQISQARAALSDPRAPIPEEAEVMSDLAAVGCVDSLLLFTQSFLATELTRPTMTRTDQCSQWSSMIGFLEVAKSTTRRSGIQLTHAICLMYESLLLDRLVEADRPILLQTYSHETDTEKLLEGFKKLKRIMNYQEMSKASWLSAEKMFDRILSSSSSPASTNSAESDRNYRTIGLPKLKALLQHMRIRERNSTPRLLSVDRPYRFCWPLDKTNLDSMADFVVFSRCALDEFLEANQTRIRFKLARFEDHHILFPRPTSKPHP